MVYTGMLPKKLENLLASMVADVTINFRSCLRPTTWRKARNYTMLQEYRISVQRQRQIHVHLVLFSIGFNVIFENLKCSLQNNVASDYVASAQSFLKGTQFLVHISSYSRQEQ